MKRTLIALALSALATSALATERVYHTTESTTLAPSAFGGAGGNGGAGGSGVGGANNSRAFALGLSASTNPSTCYIIWAGGIAFKHDVYCELNKAGAPKAALALMCEQPDVRRALAVTGEFKCPAVETDDPYIRMRTR